MSERLPVPQEVWDYIERHGDTRALAQMEVDPVASRGSPELLAHLRSRRPPLNELEIQMELRRTNRQTKDYVDDLNRRDPVPCNGCTACCRGGQSVEVRPGWDDDPLAYGDPNLAIIQYPDGRLALGLNHKPNGDCIFLGATGCTIHDKRPRSCRAFDCRRLFKGATREQRREMVRANTFGETTGEIFDAARRRLDTIRPMPFEDMQGMGEFVMNRMLADKRRG